MISKYFYSILRGFSTSIIRLFFCSFLAYVRFQMSLHSKLLISAISFLQSSSLHTKNILTTGLTFSFFYGTLGTLRWIFHEFYFFIGVFQRTEKAFILLNLFFKFILSYSCHMGPLDHFIHLICIWGY